MKTMHQWLVVVGCLVFQMIGTANASEQMRSANALESGKFAVSFYGVRADQKDLVLQLRDTNLIQVPLQGGGTAQFFAAADTKLKVDGRGNTAMAKISWRPADGLLYVLKAGTGDYELKIPSGSVVNTLTSDPSGMVWGLEAAWTLISNTPVSPAVAVSLGYTASNYNLNRLQSGPNAAVAVNQKFRLTEWQGALSASKRFKCFEPYGGLRFFRQTSTLFDVGSAQRVRGNRDGLSPFAGGRWEFFPNEALSLEVAGVDEVIVAAGVSIGF